MPEMLIRPAFFILLLLVGIFALPKGLSPQWAMFFQVVATGVAFLIGAFFLLSLLPQESTTASTVFETQKWVRSALPFMFLGAMELVNSQADLIMLGLFRPMQEVGIYRAVVQGASLVMFVLIAVNMALMPTIAELYAKGDKIRLQRVITLSARVILIATLPIALALIFGGRFLLSFFFGGEFQAGGNALSILCLGQLVNAGMGSVAALLNMTGHERDTARGIAVAALLNVILNALLIPEFGMKGAAVASATSLVTWNFLMSWWVYKRIGIISTAFKIKA
jgi:O-antigen/teichoic acid export membrane protein